MIKYLTGCPGYSRQVSEVAVQLWRHSLMHTGLPRELEYKNTGTRVRWLLHWREHLPRGHAYDAESRASPRRADSQYRHDVPNYRSSKGRQGIVCRPREDIVRPGGSREIPFGPVVQAAGETITVAVPDSYRFHQYGYSQTHPAAVVRPSGERACQPAPRSRGLVASRSHLLSAGRAAGPVCRIRFAFNDFGASPRGRTHCSDGRRRRWLPWHRRPRWWHAMDVTQPDASGVAGRPLVPGGADDAARLRKELERRARRVQACAELVLELAILPGQRWESSAGASRALMAWVDSVPAVQEAVFAIWELARLDPPAGRDLVYAASGDGGQIVVAHAERASVVARSGGPFLVLADVLGKLAWRVEADEVWKDDLAMIFYELFEVAHGRPAVDDSGIPSMPHLPWHSGPGPGHG